MAWGVREVVDSTEIESGEAEGVNDVDMQPGKDSLLNVRQLVCSHSAGGLFLDPGRAPCSRWNCGASNFAREQGWWANRVSPRNPIT
jgi:hypothetical protein